MILTTRGPGLALALTALLSFGPAAAAGPLVDFDGGADDALLWSVNDHRGGHDGHRGPPAGIPVHPHGRGVEPRQPAGPDRRDWRAPGGVHPGAPQGQWRGGDRHEFRRPQPRHWGFHPEHRPWRWHGGWIRWWGWGAVWAAGAGLGSCNAYYHSRLGSCYSSCWAEASACSASYPGAPECGANYSYCANACQIEFTASFWNVCRIWVPPVPPLLDEPLPPDVAQPPVLYLEGYAYENGVPAPPAFQ